MIVRSISSRAARRSPAIQADAEEEAEVDPASAMIRRFEGEHPLDPRLVVPEGAQQPVLARVARRPTGRGCSSRRRGRRGRRRRAVRRRWRGSRRWSSCRSAFRGQGRRPCRRSRRGGAIEAPRRPRSRSPDDDGGDRGVRRDPLEEAAELDLAVGDLLSFASAVEIRAGAALGAHPHQCRRPSQISGGDADVRSGSDSGAWANRVEIRKPLH